MKPLTPIRICGVYCIYIYIYIYIRHRSCGVACQNALLFGSVFEYFKGTHPGLLTRGAPLTTPTFIL